MRKKILFLFVYLFGFPVAGALSGLLLYWVLSLINPGISPIALEVALIVWIVFGIYIGVRGAVGFIRIENFNRKVLQHNAKDKN